MKNFGLAVMTLLLVSCGKNPNGTSVTSGHTLYEPLGRWNKKEISVCLGNYEDLRQTRFNDLDYIEPDEILTSSSKDFVLIKETIIKEYDQNEVGVKFVGWKKCSGNSDVVFVLANSQNLPYAGRAPIGQYSRVVEYKNEFGFVLDNNQGKTYVLINIDSLENYPSDVRITDIKSIAIHEFGHLLGLRHEHARPESLKDPLYPLPDCEETVGKTAKKSGSYDPYSIMNYQLSDYLEKRGNRFDGSKLNLDPRVFRSAPTALNKDNAEYVPRLSTGDVHTLRCMYVYSAKEVREKCQ